MKINEEAKKMIEENPVAIATVGDEIPNISAAAFVKVQNDKIVITNNYMSTTIKNIQKNPLISIIVWNKEWKGYKLNGKAEYFKDGKWQAFVKSIKQNENESCKGAIVVEINEIKKIE